MRADRAAGSTLLTYPQDKNAAGFEGVKQRGRNGLVLLQNIGCQVRDGSGGGGGNEVAVSSISVIAFRLRAP